MSLASISLPRVTSGRRELKLPRLSLLTSIAPRSISSKFKLSSSTICSNLRSHKGCNFSLTNAFKSPTYFSLLVSAQYRSAIVKLQSFFSTLDATFSSAIGAFYRTDITFAGELEGSSTTTVLTSSVCETFRGLSAISLQLIW